jgi:hypothetical protein
MGAKALGEGAFSAANSDVVIVAGDIKKSLTLETVAKTDTMHRRFMQCKEGVKFLSVFDKLRWVC